MVPLETAFSKALFVGSIDGHHYVCRFAPVCKNISNSLLQGFTEETVYFVKTVYGVIPGRKP
ncbi:hypothetical protein [Liquorilactobacillus sicerae]|uniref:hypothetical protein n=1 Tax=Liquorilactobacillus sicerae TaxID=1416943 RepID=UPI002480A17A|nr:hypothetical protein [Liquorilactobacillus sicerae]